MNNATTTTTTTTTPAATSTAKKGKKDKKNQPATPPATTPVAAAVPEVPAAVEATTPAAAAPVAAAAETTAAPAAEGKKLPFGGKQAPPFKTLGERDAFGFGQETETSWLLAQLMTGKHTKVTLLASFLDKFVPDGQKAEQGRKKTSFSVFFSDVVKPFGTYHASRSLVIVAEPETNVLKLTPESVKRCKDAIKAGILDKLRGFNPKKHREKINTVLKEFKLPLLNPPANATEK